MKPVKTVRKYQKERAETRRKGRTVVDPAHEDRLWYKHDHLLLHAALDKCQSVTRIDEYGIYHHPFHVSSVTGRT